VPKYVEHKMGHEMAHLKESGRRTDSRMMYIVTAVMLAAAMVVLTLSALIPKGPQRTDWNRPLLDQKKQ
jgi:hypothetical protein